MIGYAYEYNAEDLFGPDDPSNTIDNNYSWLQSISSVLPPIPEEPTQNREHKRKRKRKRQQFKKMVTSISKPKMKVNQRQQLKPKPKPKRLSRQDLYDRIMHNMYKKRPRKVLVSNIERERITMTFKDAMSQIGLDYNEYDTTTTTTTTTTTNIDVDVVDKKFKN